MNLENAIKGVIETKLSDGMVEKIIEKKFESCIDEAVADLFKSYGIVGKQINQKLSEVLVPAIEQYDFSDFVVKLDVILTEIVNRTNLADNKKILENFKELMTEDIPSNKITISDLFDKWCDCVAKEVETDGLSVDCEDGPQYEYVSVTMKIKYEDTYDWSSYEKANIVFECEHDEKMNFIVPITKWKKFDGDTWRISYNPEIEFSINSIQNINSFEVFLLKLKRCCCKLEIDCEDITEGIKPEAEPEVYFA